MQHSAFEVLKMILWEQKRLSVILFIARTRFSMFSARVLNVLGGFWNGFAASSSCPSLFVRIQSVVHNFPWIAFPI